jgi:acetyltransferase-like isoleucine patch superfamily enzyme
MFDVFARLKNKVRSTLWRWVFRWDFHHFGAGTTVIRPLRIQGARWISIGAKVIILDSAWLLVLPPSEAAFHKKPILSIGDGTYVGHFSHITAMVEVNIGKKVLIADRVYISDNLHSFEDVEIPVIDQPVKFRAGVEIGDGSWIGENACIIGSRVGRHCVVAANAVVTRDVPDFCVVAGTPARIVKRYDAMARSWIRVKD